MKKLYLMGKLHEGEESISEFSDKLESRGHEVLEKWWKEEMLPVPYLDYPETSSVAARRMLDAAYNSDVAILFPGPTILGGAVEFGEARASQRVNPNKQVIVVNPYETRQSVFYAHPGVLAVRSLVDIRQMDWY